MRRVTLLLAGSLLAGLPASPVEAGDVHLRLGALFPRADTGASNDLFRDVNELFTKDADLSGVDSKDWVGVYGGAEYSLALGDGRFELGFHVDGYGRTLDTSYRDLVDFDGREIFQTLKVTSVPTGVTLRVAFGNRGRVQPYLGGGIDAVWYRYEQFGDFVDFVDPNQPVIPDSFLSEGWALGAHAVAGVRVPISYDIALVAEGRYLWAGAEMGGDFRQNRIDLSGGSATLGVLIRF